METTERIVEAYVRYIKGWATIPNIKCAGQFEIDLLAIDPVSCRKYHIESGVSTASGFSTLTCKPFSRGALRDRVKQPAQRRTLGFFLERKFNPPQVRDRLAEHGFRDDYRRVIVSWGWTDEVASEAERHGVELWDFRDILRGIDEALDDKTAYFADDTLRTLHLFARARKERTSSRRPGVHR